MLITRSPVRPPNRASRSPPNIGQSILTNNVTVNLQVGYSALGSTVIGSTTARSATVSTASVYQQLAATGNSALDALALANMRPLDANGGVSFIADGIVNGAISKTVKVYDHDSSLNNRMLDVNTSVLKALGYSGYTSGADASITFSSNFAFDFNPTDGIQAGKIDFIGTAIHEIGHALGFTSGVDDYDYYTQTASHPDMNAQAEFSTLDLFRYSMDPKNVVPGNGRRARSVYGRTPFFSIDGATVFNGAYMSSGRYAGDGHQASHFKDSRDVARRSASWIRPSAARRWAPSPITISRRWMRSAGMSASMRCTISAMR